LGVGAWGLESGRVTLRGYWRRCILADMAVLGPAAGWDGDANGQCLPICVAGYGGLDSGMRLLATPALPSERPDVICMY